MIQTNNTIASTEGVISDKQDIVVGIFNISDKKSLIVDSNYHGSQPVFDYFSASSSEAPISAHFLAKAITQTEKAKQEFIELAGNIPDVSVQTFGGLTLAEQSIRVIVQDILSNAAHQVRLAEIQVRRAYKDVKLNLEIVEENDHDHDSRLTQMKTE